MQLYTFVFAVKKNKFHYSLSATVPVENEGNPENIAKQFAAELEKKVSYNTMLTINY